MTCDHNGHLANDHGRPNHYECTVPDCSLTGHKRTYPTPVTDQREMAGWMAREEAAFQQGRPTAAQLHDVICVPYLDQKWHDGVVTGEWPCHDILARLPR